METTTNNTTSNDGSGIETDQMEGFSVNPDSGIASSSGHEYSASSRGDTTSASASGHTSSTAAEEDPERQLHFGPANPLGPISSAPSDGRTTKSTTTEEDGRGNAIHTSIYTTVCTNGQAYRTTRVTNVHRLLSATYEMSVPLGTTHRIIRTYHRGTNNHSQPYYDQTTEIVTPGGSTTIRHQKFDMDDKPMNAERIQELPPMEITPKPGWTAAATMSPMAGAAGRVSAYFGLGGSGGGSGGNANNEEDITIISELSNPRISRPIDVDEQHTLAGMTTRYDDPTVDPTVIDYNAGYSEEMARKHNTLPQQMAVGDMVGGIGYDAERALPPQPPPGVEGASSPASSNRSGKKSFGTRGSNQSGGGSKANGAGISGNGNANANGNANWSMASENDYSRSTKGGASATPNKRRQPMSTQTKMIIFGTGVLIVAIAVGAAVGAVTAKSGGGKTSGGSGGDSGDDSVDDPTPAPGPGSPPTQPSAPLNTDEILAKSGFDRHWDSEEGWPVAPSYASFVPNDKIDIGEASYYDAFYLPDLATCADRCDKTDSAGGAYFDLSDEDKRNVCLCFKDTQCYDTKLAFSGGTVFVREENFVSESDECQMSTCGYFPDDPICDGLNIIDLESELDVELRKVERLMQDDDIRAFQQACADFLNDQFSQTDSPVEGVRCHLLTQDLAGGRRRRLASSVTRVMQENDTLVLEMRVTGLFVPTNKYADADSVAFDASILDFFSQQGSKFLQSLRNDEDAFEYYENVRGISIKTSGFPSEPVPEPTPTSPTDAPSPSPTRMPVTWPTTDAPSRSPTKRPTKEPSLAPTKSPNARPTPAPTTPAPTPLPTLPPVPSAGNPSRYCLGQNCWQQIGSTMTSKFLGDQFGDEVKLDLSGGRFSVSASLSSQSGYFESGTVKVFDEEDGQFIAVGQELYGFEAGDRIRGVLSGNGRRLAVYTHKRDNDTGRVWIYELQNGEWVEIWKILGESEGERFGSSVALNTDGSIVAIGVPFAYDKQGAVRVYAERNGNWRQLGSEIVGQFRDGKLGWDVAFASNALMLVAGQKSDDNNSVSGRSGQIRVFQYSGSNVNANGSFEQFGQAILGDNAGDDFGRTVAISATGTIVAAGARYHDGAGRVDSGQVKARSYFGGGLWFEIKGSEIIGDNANDQLMNLAMNANGDRIAAGAGQGDGGIGYIRVYDNASGNGWEQIGGKLTGLNDNENFGSDISMSADGKRLLVGSPARDNSSILARVRLFELISS